jgi:4-hydroxy-tetrahydrodipicolinate reductase
VNPTRVAICGITGRMGQTLVRLIDDAEDLELAGGIADAHEADTARNIVTVDRCGALLDHADIVIDFSAPAAIASVMNAALARDGSLPAMIIGTTGYGDDVTALIDRAAQRTAVVTAANFSVGVNLLLDLVERAAAVLDTRFDIEIVEAHHRNKVDAPSGTALALGQAAARGRGVSLDDVRRDGRSGNTGKRPAGEITFHALRGGAVVGEHHVNFLGDVERVVLSHIATDRVLFADGAIAAARWARDRTPGRYSMRDVLGLED